MSIPGVSGVSRVTGSGPETPASMPSIRPGPPAAVGGVDTPVQPSPPLRFPWLSRLSQELAPAAPQKPAFPPAPVLGDNVDRSV